LTIRLERIAPVIAVALACTAAFNAIDALPVGVFYDDALYTILGKAIASGEGYRYLNLPGRPLATHYPPGYPLLLAMLWRVSPTFPQNVALFKAVNALLVGVVAWMTFRFARSRLDNSPWLAAAIALAGTATIPLLVLSSAVMSEALFLALLLPWLLAAERATTRSDARTAIALGILGGLLFYVRAHAFVLVPALAIGYALSRNRRDALIALVSGIAIMVPWFLWVAAHDGGIPAPLRGAYGSYGAWLAHGVREHGPGIIVLAVRDNAITVAAILARSFALTQRQPFAFLAVAAVLALAVLGGVALYARARVTLLFLCLYLATVLVWPFSPLRFIWGVWPLVVLLLVAGIELAVAQRGAGAFRRAVRAGGIVATVLVVAGMLLFNVRGYVNAWWTTVSRAVTPRIQPQLEWVAVRTDSSDIVAADDEGAVFLYTGRRAVPANVFTAVQYFARRPASEDAANLAAIIAALRPTYVVAWADPTVSAAEVLTTRHPVMLQRTDTIRGGRVYRVRR